MKKTTKNKILQQALNQFNSEGVERVTTSSIAKNLGMSLGNLHYHFPNRDSIIIKLVDLFLQEEAILAKKLQSAPMANFMVQAFTAQFLTYRNCWEYRFIFSDRLVIQRRTNYLELRFKEMVEIRRKEFEMTMATLQSNGIVKSEFSTEIMDAYFVQIVIGNNSWISYVDLFDFDSPPYFYFAKCAIRTWKPYLTCTEQELEDTMQIAIDVLGRFEKKELDQINL